MSKVRNRAQAAAAVALSPTYPPALENTADAVSDVWEPLVREALSVIYDLIRDSGGTIAPDLGLRIMAIEENLT